MLDPLSLVIGIVVGANLGVVIAGYLRYLADR